MTNKPQATITGNDNLIALENEAGAFSQARDINSKINTLEDSLGELQTELNQINRSVEEGLDRLSDTDLDLTSKVSETYKRLGEIDQTYKALSGISDAIDSDVKKLAQEISTVAEQSMAELENIEATSSDQFSQVNAQHAQLALRVRDLVKNAHDTHEQLTKSISHNTDALLSLEKQLVGEIDTLSDSTQQRDDKLEAGLDEAVDAIAVNKANILRMQAIDEALDRRAAELEKTSAELTGKTRELQSSLAMLETYTNGLAFSVEQLQEQSDKQASQIVDIQVNTSLMSRTITALAGTEKRHFQVLSAALVIIALVIASLGYYQYSVNGSDVQQIAGVQTDIASINRKLQTVDDQVGSLDGRLTYSSPFSQFGKDSVIKGPQWLATQPANNFAVVIASSTDMQGLYTIAQRYSHYFTEDMAYYTVKTWQGERYVLAYGSFASGQQAASVLWRMPHVINQQRPVISRIGDIQKHI